MKKLYDKIFSTKLLKKIMNVKLFNKLLSYEILSYLFFGVMTTLVNFVVLHLFVKILGTASLFDFSVFKHTFSITFEDVSNFIAWVFSVLFAYVTNKLWVFESKSKKVSVVVKELLSFFGARVISYVVFEFLGFMLLRNVFNLVGIFSTENARMWIAKILIAVFVVVFNYIMSKLVIFRNKNNAEGENSNESE